MGKRKIDAVESHDTPLGGSSDDLPVAQKEFDPQTFLTRKHSRRPNLCNRCASIDFPAITRATQQRSHHPHKGHPLIDIGTFDHVKSAKCELCQIFADAISKQKQRSSKSSYHLRGFDSHQVYGLNYQEYNVKDPCSLVMTVMPGRPVKTSAHSRTFVGSIRNGVITPVDWPCLVGERPDKYLYEARVRPDQVDYRLLLQYITKCEINHKQCRNSASENNRLLDIRVIDCAITPKAIVPLGKNTEYLALSYVWGKSTGTPPSEVKNLGRILPGMVPLTIKDAMEVVCNLGYRYLWIDQYCINQADFQDKHVQISMMDRIYENAVLTIVALGDDVESGLPGVSRIQRSPQPYALTDFGILASTLPPLSTTLPKSHWAGRGWTYQEMVLSRKCLFFTNEQVHFACKCGVYRESANEPLGQIVENPYFHTYKTLTLNSKLCKAEDSVFRYDSSDFGNHLLEYTSRNLSYTSDALNAFRGILARSDVATYWGVPILWEWRETSDDGNTKLHGSELSSSRALKVNLGFAYGLLWVRGFDTWKTSPQSVDSQALRTTAVRLVRKDFSEVTVETERTPNFPTWSWASVQGQIKLDRVSYSQFDADLVPEFHVEDSAGKLISLATLALQRLETTNEIVIPEDDARQRLHVTNLTVVWKEEPSRFERGPRPEVEDSRITYFNREYGRMCTQIFIDGDISDMAFRQKLRGEGGHGWDLVLLSSERFHRHDLGTGWWMILDRCDRDGPPNGGGGKKGQGNIARRVGLVQFLQVRKALESCLKRAERQTFIVI